MDPSFLYETLPIVLLALIAQWGREYPPRRRLVIGFLSVLSGIVFLIGFLLLTFGFIGGLLGEQMGNKAFGMSSWLLIGSLLSGLSLFPRVRKFLSRLMPGDLDSTARVVGFWLYILVLTLFVGVGANFDLLNELTALPQQEFTTSLNLTPGLLLLSGLSFPLMALFGAGFPLKRSLRGVAVRLGLGPVRRGHWVWICGFVAAAFVFDALFSVLLNTFSAGTEQKINQVLSMMAGVGQKSWLELLVLAISVGISAGVGEELLFRGLLQPVFGIFLSAALFASLHWQYGFTLALVQMLVWGIALGFVKNKTNTTVVILAHFLYDLLAVLLTGFA